MNEHDWGKKIASHLTQGLTGLDRDTLSRLQGARKAALARHAQPRRVFGLTLATAGGGFGHATTHHHYFRYLVWLPILGLVIGLLAMDYWQQQNETAEIDVHLLAADLPIHAYLDPDFDQWLEDSSQQ